MIKRKTHTKMMYISRALEFTGEAYIGPGGCPPPFFNFYTYSIFGPLKLKHQAPASAGVGLKSWK